MTCSDTRAKLTAYLDGELDADRGSVVRGHLRTCEACRDIAEREAALRDGLRALPTIDPPPSLWSNVQARLAALEVGDAQRPAWRRALARYTRWMSPSRLALAGTAVTAAVVLMWWRQQPAPVETHEVIVVRPTPEKPRVIPEKPKSMCKPVAPPADDVTADLQGEPARLTAMYCVEAEAQLAAAAKVATWTVEQRTAFERRAGELRKRYEGATDERTKQRALRELIRYAQTSITRDAVALAEVAP